MSVDPPIPYYGSKMRMASTIGALLPAHDHYVEVFAGSLAVLLAKPRSAAETVNDLDGRLMTFWRVLRDRPRDLAWVCGLTPHSRAEVHLAHEEPICDHYPQRLGMCEDCDLEQARRVFSALTQTRAGKLHDSGWRYRVGVRGVTPIAQNMDTYTARLIPAAARLRMVSLECLPALDLVQRYGDDPNVCIYADPPYLRETRAGTAYRLEMETEEQHRELAEALAKCQAAVVVSGYRSPLYDDLYAGWYVEEWPTTTQQGGARKATCEVLWANRPLGGRVQLSLLDGGAEDGPQDA
jgi:DNA adenine methylase